jgi:hypothetical protein
MSIRKGELVMFKVYKETISGSSYQFKIKTTFLKKTPSLIEAQSAIKNHLLKKRVNVVRFYIEETSKHSYLSIIFDNEGRFLYNSSALNDDIPFHGNDKPKYKEGDIVEVFRYDTLDIGIVCAVPETTQEILNWKKKLKGQPNQGFTESDNVYLVNFLNNKDDQSENPHDHPQEFQLSHPSHKVPSTKAQKLQTLFKRHQE